MGAAAVVREGTALPEAAECMLRQQVGAVIVVNARGLATGILSERHLTLNERYLRLSSIAVRPLTARDLMDTYLIRVRIDEPLSAVVDRMLRRGADYAVVHQSGTVVGLLGSHDLLRQVAGKRADSAAPRPVSIDGQCVAVALEQPSVLGWLLGAQR
jgi:CBS domain-containing protein